MNGGTKGRTLAGLVLVALGGFPVLGTAQGVPVESPVGTADADVVELEGATVGSAPTADADVHGASLRCMLCVSDGQTHWFEDYFCLGGTVGPFTCARCGGTSSCHLEPQPGPCHVECGWEWPTQEDLADAAETLVEHADSYGLDVAVVALVSLINENDRLEFNQTRKAVQLFDCRGGVVGQWRVSDDMVVALAQHVA